MTDREIVGVLRHYVQNSRKLGIYPGITGLCVTIEQAADRIANQETHVRALQKAIEDLRHQNEQLREAAALVTKESADLLERQWIPMTEQLPEYNARVLAIDVYNGNENEDIGIWTREKIKGDEDDCWIDSVGWWHAPDEATHWMPLPEPPKNERSYV